MRRAEREFGLLSISYMSLGCSGASSSHTGELLLCGGRFMTIAELAEDASYWRQHIESTRAATLSQTPLDAALVDRGVARNSGKYCAQGHLMAALGFQDH